jgi:hypothetical protein
MRSPDSPQNGCPSFSAGAPFVGKMYGRCEVTIVLGEHISLISNISDEIYHLIDENIS